MTKCDQELEQTIIGVFCNIASNTELSINKDDVAREVADVVEKAFQKKCFDQRPPACVVAQKERKKIPEDPEKKFIKLSP